MSTNDPPVTVLGGGPAGLTAGYLLARRGIPTIVFEAERQVGGIAKTVERDGYRFDLGGHRFFTKAKEVDALWHEIMREEFLRRPRMSRIYWNRKFLHYPLRGTDVIKKLGPIELIRAMTSYLRAALFASKGNEQTFEEWVSNRFGRRLFNLFFKSYTEKVWGVPTSEIRAEWAAQRIKNLNFFSAAKAAFFGNKDDEHTSLIGEFNYPRYGPGQMWETMAEDIRRLSGEVRLSTPVTEIEVRNGRAVSLVAGGGGCRSAASRTSAPGAHGWCPTPRRRASGWSTSASPATSCGPPTTTSSSASAPASSSSSGWPEPTWSTSASSCGCRRPTRCTTPTTRSAWPSYAPGSTPSRISNRSGATGYTATTIPTTRC